MHSWPVLTIQHWISKRVECWLEFHDEWEASITVKFGLYPSPIMKLGNVNHHVDKVYDIFLIFQKKKKKYTEAAMRSNILSRKIWQWRLQSSESTLPLCLKRQLLISWFIILIEWNFMNGVGKLRWKEHFIMFLTKLKHRDLLESDFFFKKKKKN